MKQVEIQALANGTASILLSYAAHGLATSTIEGMGEITLRDGSIVAAAAVGAQSRQAWILERELLPSGWTDVAVDVVITRVVNQSTPIVGGTEIKWWRRDDPSNSANRRRDLIKDLIRAASLYTIAEDFAFVALLSTAGSWSATTTTKGSDKAAMAKLVATGSQKWNIPGMIASKAIQGSIRQLKGKVPVPNIFHTKLLAEQSINGPNGIIAFAKVWAVKKPQKTKFFSIDEIDELAPPDSDDDQPILDQGREHLVASPMKVERSAATA